MNVDFYLKQLASVPVPDLDAIDGAHLALRARNEHRQGRMMLTTAGIAALIVGVAGSVLPVDRAEASVVPFGPPSALVPLVQLGRE